jgi:hypothetical protein
MEVDGPAKGAVIGEVGQFGQFGAAETRKAIDAASNSHGIGSGAC